jgi:hypothetical protein
MPIPLNIFDSKYKPPMYEKHKEVYNTMSVYFQSKSPEHIFKQRRPLESKDNVTLEHRKENHRNFLKDAFDLTLVKCIETAQGVDYKSDFTESEFKKYIENYKITKNSITLTLDEYLTNNLFKYSENDPNSFVVVMPKHPTETINPVGNISPDEITQLPNFNNITNKNIEMELIIVPFKDVLFVDNNRLIFKGGTWELENKSHNYYFEVSKDYTIIWIPKYSDRVIEYNSYIYYNNNLSENPFIPTKNNYIIYDHEGLEFQYNVSHLFSATYLADMIYGQQSDLQVTAIRHVYPIKTQVKTNCENIIGYEMKNGVHCSSDTGLTCSTCSGKGYRIDETPYGTILVDNKIGVEGELRGLNAVAYTSPDTAPMTFNKELIKEYKDELYNLLGITTQNNTNASAESKRMDMQQRVSRITIIVKDILRVKESVYRVMENFFTRKDPTFKLVYDGGFDVQNDEDISIELEYAKKNGYPIELRREILKRLYLKKNGKTADNEFIIDFLINNDILFGYDLDEVQKQVAIFGSLIGDKQILVHNLGERILKEIIKKKDSTEALELETITTEFNSRIDDLRRQNT